MEHSFLYHKWAWLNTRDVKVHVPLCMEDTFSITETCSMVDEEINVTLAKYLPYPYS